MIRLLAFLFLVMTTAANAQSKIGVMGSVLYNVPEVSRSGSDSVEEESEAGFGLGMRALIPLTSGLYLRTGAGFVEKNFSYEIEEAGQTGKASVSFLYVNIPATLYFYGLDQKLGVFAGTAINAKLSDECKNTGTLDICDEVDDKSLIFPIVLGFDFSLSEKISMELSYEHGIMKTTSDVKVSSAILSFIYNL